MFLKATCQSLKMCNIKSFFFNIVWIESNSEIYCVDETFFHNYYALMYLIHDWRIDIFQCYKMS